MNDKKIEQVEQVEENEVELEVKKVKTLKTNLKGGMEMEDAEKIDTVSGGSDYCRPRTHLLCV